MELEDQSGQKLQIGSETDHRGAMMGVMLHTKGKNLIEKEKIKDALEVLLMAEEAFSLCAPKLVEMIDNIPILQLDIVWCYFLLKDISCLSVAGARLAKARLGFERSHGKDFTRFRALQDGRHQDLAIYLRLELLEGVVAYHSGNHEESRKALNSALSKYNQLQVSDEALSQLMGMGYKEKAAKRALKMTGQDMESAVGFLVEERAKKMRRYEEDKQRREEKREQKLYGTTPMKKAVDIKRLNELASIGFDRELAAEALRVNENDTQLALDHLTDPDKNCKLQSKIESRRQARAQRAAVQGLSEVAAQGNAIRGSAEVAALGDTAQGSAEVAAEVAAVAAAVEDTNPIDFEMEDELIRNLKGDAIADYDIEVTKEGEAIAEYLSLLDSSGQQSIGSSSL
ncbi:NEDD8 ultimate buster 1 [Asparagus officinalis]|uniref:NEDD8 ultimate buster 1 n=1 Tax=Asparagus officinalis TaxID=4686 RepID=UPI00098E5F9B|nr:NEDD8 ultimate buster 1 [Asparagus officinalis]XP_020259329.1 NEDD8 ultimate buster 1 [Asparagus officinalis]